MPERIIIFLLTVVILVAVYALVQAVSFVREANRSRAAMEAWEREIAARTPSISAVAPAPALSREEEYRQAVEDTGALPRLPIGTFAARATAMRLAEDRIMMTGSAAEPAIGEDDYQRMSAEEAQEISASQAVAEVERELGLPPLPGPPEVAMHRRLNIGGQTYDVPDMAEGDNMAEFERRTVNDLMLRRGRQLMVENNWTAAQAAEAVRQMVNHAGIAEVAGHAVDPHNLLNSMQDGTLTPDARLRLAEDMMMRHAENLIRGGMPVAEAAERSADWGMQFAQISVAPRAERRPTVREAWSD